MSNSVLPYALALGLGSGLGLGLLANKGMLSTEGGIFRQVIPQSKIPKKNFFQNKKHYLFGIN
jgi:hypothetical protein